MVAAGLGEIAPGGYPQFDAQVLEQNGHEVGQQDDGEEGVTELRPARQVGGPVPRVHVTHGHQKARPGEDPHFFPEGQMAGHSDRAMDFRQAHSRTLLPPGTRRPIGLNRARYRLGLRQLRLRFHAS